MTAEHYPGKNFYEIFVALKNNDGQILKQVYQQHYTMVEQYILQNSGTAEDAKDLYQEAFVAVWRNIQLNKFEPQHAGSLTAYIMQVSKNKWISALRATAGKQHVSIEEDALDNAGELPAEENNYISLVAAQFSHLGDNCKELLGRFYYKKESLKDIGAHFNWTEATAKNNKYRCLEKLRNLLKNHL